MTPELHSVQARSSSLASLYSTIFGDAAALVCYHASILARLVRLEAQHHGGGRIVGMQPVEHGAHGGFAHERHVAIQHQHIAREIAERRLRLLHRMAGAQLRFLQGSLHIVAQRRLQLLASCAHHHNLARRSQRIDRMHQVVDHRASGNRVQHLVQRRLHARAFSGGKDDGGELVFVCHGGTSADSRHRL